MADSDIYAGLTRIFSDVFMRDDIVLGPETTAKDVEGWDSFCQIEIIIAIEEHYNIKFSPKEIDAMQNIGALARLITDKIG